MYLGKREALRLQSRVGLHLLNIKDQDFQRVFDVINTVRMLPNREINVEGNFSEKAESHLQPDSNPNDRPEHACLPLGDHESHWSVLLLLLTQGYSARALTSKANSTSSQLPQDS